MIRLGYACFNHGQPLKAESWPVSADAPARLQRSICRGSRSLGGAFGGMSLVGEIEIPVKTSTYGKFVVPTGAPSGIPRRDAVGGAMARNRI